MLTLWIFKVIPIHLFDSSALNAIIFRGAKIFLAPQVNSFSAHPISSHILGHYKEFL